MSKVANHPLGSGQLYSFVVRVKGESPAKWRVQGPNGPLGEYAR